MVVPVIDGIFQLVTVATPVIIVCDGEHQQPVITLSFHGSLNSSEIHWSQ